MFDSTSKFIVIRYNRNETDAIEMDKKIPAPGDNIEESMQNFDNTTYGRYYIELIHVSRQ